MPLLPAQRGETMEADYLKIGNKVFGITPIDAEGVDVNEELKDFYQHKEGRLKEAFGNVITQDAHAEWNTQISHLQKFSGRGEIKIPRQLFGKSLMVYSNILMETKQVVYAPTEVVTSRRWLVSGDYDIEGVVFPEEDTTILLTIKPIFHLPMLIAYHQRSNKLYTPFIRTIHTMGGNYICTGNYRANDFWALALCELSREMNRINTFSPASRRVHYDNHTWELKEMINRHTITNVVRRESVEWRT